jgi:bacillolysin
VLLYGKKNYGGPAETFTSSNPDFKQTLGGPHPVSSLAIEGNATAILFEKPGYNCESNAAYWIGGDGLAAFGEGWVVEDILMHEWTHALTAHTARLEYRNESGALNESFSDVFACFLDSDDWTIGEDLPHGPIRSLQNPPGYGQPDRVADTRQLPDDREHDWGGVHTNSGIPNKAAWLMTDGGALEGVTVRGIGRKKAEQIYYRALTAHLMPASDFRDGALALLESARELEGTHDITPQDTESVRSALVAVGMLPAGDLYGEIRP